MSQTKGTLVGLNKHHRISWNDPYNRACMLLASFGFSIDTIAFHTGLTPSQVAYRCGKKNISVLDYRNGNSSKAMTLLNRYGIGVVKKKTG